MKIEADSFAEGTPIPVNHSYRGGNVSPQLKWTSPPAGCKSYALICHDPDAPRAGGWTHWVMWDIPASATGLAAGIPHGERLGDGSRQGLNDWNESGWGGPQPPSGIHHYVFSLYALDSLLGDIRRATRDALLRTIKGHVLSRAELVGTFKAP